MVRNSSLVTAWRSAAKKLGAGTYPKDLEPRAGLQFPSFDPSPLLPPEYVAFIAEVGYGWLRTGKGDVTLLPPRWMQRVSMAMGRPGMKWETVRRERAAGTHTYEYVMFAAWDISDVHGWAFGRNKDSGAVTVWLVEDSLPVAPAGSFEEWLSSELSKLAKGRAKRGEPLDLTGQSFDLDGARKLTAGSSVLSAFEKSITELSLEGRKIGELSGEIGEFNELTLLDLSSTGLRRIPSEIGKLTKVTYLDLSWNSELVALPDELGDMRALTTIDLRSCSELIEVPKTTGKLVELKLLDLTNCDSLRSLPKELGECRRLQIVSLFNTKVSARNIEELQRLLPKCEFKR